MERGTQREREREREIKRERDKERDKERERGREIKRERFLSTFSLQSFQRYVSVLPAVFVRRPNVGQI